MFDLLFPIEEKKQPTTKCKDCEFSGRYKYGSKVIWYCKIRKSNRTTNGLLKIKANNISCKHFIKQ